MTQEDKAKAYDEALSVAQETYTTQPMYREWLAKMFPELKESEGEKTRKELIAYCQVNMGHTWHNIKQEDYITWLEKRGKKGTNGNKREIPNSEQKPVDKDKPNLLAVEQAKKMSPFMRTGFENEPTAWSEEGEYLLGETIQRLEELIRIAKYCGIDVRPYQRDIDWVKSLKDRVGCETNCTTTKEWSEEDLYRIEHALFGTYAVDFATRLLNKIKSLNSQNTWRPSDEQIEALESATENCAYSEYQDCLRELIKQLRVLQGDTKNS